MEATHRNVAMWQRTSSREPRRRLARDLQYSPRMRSVLLVSLVLASGACVTARGRADAAYVRADYVSAADQYGELFAHSPRDAALRERRDEARTQALTSLALQVHDARLAGHHEDAMHALDALLARRDAWPRASGTWTAQAIATESAAAATFIEREVVALAATQPLGAEERLGARHALLDYPELASLWPALATRVREAGQARCRTLTPAHPDDAPYHLRLAAEYCAHFGAAVAGPAHLPAGLGRVETSGAITGMSAAQRARVDASLARALRQSPWFESTSDARATVDLTGYQAATFGAAPVRLEAVWSETQTYTERESYQESYQESYRESYQEPYQESYQESYTQQVPHTQYGTESYSCGYGTTSRTCTRSTTHTSYSSETRYRTSYRTAYRTAHRTAYRTAYRTAWRDVTKTRLVPHVFEYDAIQRVGVYSGSWQMAVGLVAAAPPLAVTVAGSDREQGYDHDVTFAPAGVAPSRAQLPSFDGWFEALLEKLAIDVPSALREHWRTAFCQAPSFGLESAARCAYGAALPPTGRAELATLFGQDVDRVIASFAGAPALRE